MSSNNLQASFVTTPAMGDAGTRPQSWAASSGFTRPVIQKMVQTQRPLPFDLPAEHQVLSPSSTMVLDATVEQFEAPLEERTSSTNVLSNTADPPSHAATSVILAPGPAGHQQQEPGFPQAGSFASNNSDFLAPDDEPTPESSRRQSRADVPSLVENPLATEGSFEEPGFPSQSDEEEEDGEGGGAHGLRFRNAARVDLYCRPSGKQKDSFRGTISCLCATYGMQATSYIELELSSAYNEVFPPEEWGQWSQCEIFEERQEGPGRDEQLIAEVDLSQGDPAAAVAGGEAPAGDDGSDASTSDGDFGSENSVPVSEGGLVLDARPASPTAPVHLYIYAVLWTWHLAPDPQEEPAVPLFLRRHRDRGQADGDVALSNFQVHSYFEETVNRKGSHSACMVTDGNGSQHKYTIHYMSHAQLLKILRLQDDGTGTTARNVLFFDGEEFATLRCQHDFLCQELNVRQIWLYDFVVVPVLTSPQREEGQAAGGLGHGITLYFNPWDPAHTVYYHTSDEGANNQILTRLRAQFWAVDEILLRSGASELDEFRTSNVSGHANSCALCMVNVFLNLLFWHASSWPTWFFPAVLASVGLSQGEYGEYVSVLLWFATLFFQGKCTQTQYHEQVEAFIAQAVEGAETMRDDDTRDTVLRSLETLTNQPLPTELLPKIGMSPRGSRVGVVHPTCISCGLRVPPALWLVHQQNHGADEVRRCHKIQATLVENRDKRRNKIPVPEDGSCHRCGLRVPGLMKESHKIACKQIKYHRFVLKRICFKETTRSPMAAVKLRPMSPPVVREKRHVDPNAEPTSPSSETAAEEVGEGDDEAELGRQSPQPSDRHNPDTIFEFRAAGRSNRVSWNEGEREEAKQDAAVKEVMEKKDILDLTLPSQPEIRVHRAVYEEEEVKAKKKRFSTATNPSSCGADSPTPTVAQSPRVHTRVRSSVRSYEVSVVPLDLDPPTSPRLLSPTMRTALNSQPEQRASARVQSYLENCPSRHSTNLAAVDPCRWSTDSGVGERGSWRRSKVPTAEVETEVPPKGDKEEESLPETKKERKKREKREKKQQEKNDKEERAQRYKDARKAQGGGEKDCVIM